MPNPCPRRLRLDTSSELRVMHGRELTMFSFGGTGRVRLGPRRPPSRLFATLAESGWLTPGAAPIHSHGKCSFTALSCVDNGSGYWRRSPQAGSIAVGSIWWIEGPDRAGLRRGRLHECRGSRRTRTSSPLRRMNAALAIGPMGNGKSTYAWAGRSHNRDCGQGPRQQHRVNPWFVVSDWMLRAGRVCDNGNGRCMCTG